MKNILYSVMCGLMISTSSSFLRPTEVTGVYKVSIIFIILLTSVGLASFVFSIVLLFKKSKNE
ncbi:MAG: hypothetical protein QQN65_06360 [Nitrosopumilus sp.]